MQKFLTNQISLISILILLGCIILAQSQLNTHQTIKSGYPKIFGVDLNEKDEVKVRVFNAAAFVSMGYEARSKDFVMGTRKYCFPGSDVTFEFLSKWKVRGTIIIGLEGYEFSYQITINGKLFKREQNIVRDFLSRVFLYYKTLQPKTYNLVASYQSKILPNITLQFKGQRFTICANKANNITINLQRSTQFYDLTFTYELGTKPLEDSPFELTLQLPNQMLKGCDGTNFYDSRMRACPSKSNQEMDYLQLHKFGQYPSFQVTEKTKMFIKITIKQFQKWKQFQLDIPLTIFIAKSSDPLEFQNKTTTQLRSRYRTKQQCMMKDGVCNFIFKLDPGNYTAMPAILNTQEAFVYLFQRGYGQKVVQSYHSVLPSMNSKDNCYYHLGGTVEFVSHQEKLTEISFESPDKFFLAQYIIFGRSKTRNAKGEYTIELVETSIGNLYNQNPNKATIYAELKPDSFYLLVFVLISQDKFRKLEEAKVQLQQGFISQANQDQEPVDKKEQQLTEEDSQEQGWDEQSWIEIAQDEDWDYEDQGDDGDWDLTDDSDEDQIQTISEGINTQDVPLQTENLQISIKNGKFPHKKIQEPKLNPQNTKVNNNSSQVSESALSSVVSVGQQNSVILIGAVAGGIVVLIVLVFVCKKLKIKIGSKNQAKKLVEEQSSAVNVESNTVSTKTNIELSINTEISQVIDTDQKITQ